MYKFTFTKKAEKQFVKLELATQERIIKKLQFYKTAPEILPFLKSVENLEPATHRLRVGSHRLLLQYNWSKDIIILKVWERKSIYKSTWWICGI